MDWFILGGYLLACILFVGGAVLPRLQGRQDRQPFPAEQRLLRGPGESLRRRLHQHRQAGLADILAAFLLPVAASVALYQTVTRLEGTAQLIALLLTACVFAAALTLLARRLQNRVNQARNLYLGHFGERVVAEALEPLKTSGHLIFHDIPAGEPDANFNIDHVVVGPSGVHAIETKTRRQSARRAGFMLHEIIHDGQVLAFPWGEDRHGLDQSAAQADWLRRWLGKQLGQPVPVLPLLTFPGWTVVRRGSGPVHVLAPHEIPAHIDPTNTDTTARLSPDTIRRIAALLDARCRDVKF